MGEKDCGKWGIASFIGRKPFVCYCNAKPGHDGGCTYTSKGSGIVYTITPEE